MSSEVDLTSVDLTLAGGYVWERNVPHSSQLG